MSSGFLHELPPEARASFLNAARKVRLARGNLIYHTEDAAETLYVLASGRVRLYRIGAGAREVTVAVHEAGELFGTAGLGGETPYGHYAEALEEGEVLAVGGAALRELLRAQPALGVSLSAQLTKQTRALQERLAQLVFLEVSQRLAGALLAMAEGSGAEGGGGNSAGQNSAGQKKALKGRISHQDLAYLVGSTRETITKLLGEFKERGLLDLGYRRIVVLDEAGLRDVAEHPIHS